MHTPPPPTVNAVCGSWRFPRTCSRAVLALALSLGLAACDRWLGERDAPPLPGERISVLAHERTLSPDVDNGDPIALPRPEPNDDWPQAGGYSHNAMQHMVLADAPRRVWTSSAGRAPGSRDMLLAGPVMADGAVFAIDAGAAVTALDARSGRRLWSTATAPREERSGSLRSGGLAHEDGRLFVTTGFAQVIALDARSGEVLWRTPVNGPMRAAPAVNGGRVFAITVDNTVHALSAESGEILWSHTGVEEMAALLGGASPAVDSGVVVAPTSAGELLALRVENGSLLWSDTLISVRRTDAVSSLADIRGRPVIDRGVVYAVSHSDLMAAIDLRTGARLWEIEVGGINQPWVAGRFLFVVDKDAQLIAVEARTGQIRWVTQLDLWENPERRTGRILWYGPVLAGDRLIVAGSHGEAVAVSPYSGRVLGVERLPRGVNAAPIIADETLFFLLDNADVAAYR